MKMNATPSRVVVVTGASSGIGKAIAERFARAGDTVIALARSRGRLNMLVRSLRLEGVRCSAMVCDLRDEQAVKKTFRTMFRQFGSIDILINNAGVTRFKSFSETSVKDFDEIVDTNLRALFLSTQQVLPQFVRRRKGLIINVLSFATIKIYSKSSVYSASKSGATVMMDVLREETRSKGIQVLNVHPGAVRTPMWPKGIQRNQGLQMLDPKIVAEAVLQATYLPLSAMLEEIVLRPQTGDLNV